MNKVLIVDDEFLIRAGFKTAIDWKSCNCEIVGLAKNASDAILLYRKYYPDIVITEISLPDINGLALIPQLKQINENAKYIILTRSQSFEYAKKAIQLNVSEYLLKSEVSQDTLQNILNSFDITPNNDSSIIYTVGSSASSLFDYITGDLILDNVEINDLFTQSNLNSNKYVILSIDIFYNTTDEINNENTFSNEHSHDIIKKIKSDLPSNIFNIVLLYKNNLIYAIVSFTNSISLIDIVKSIHKALDERYNGHSLIGVSMVLSDHTKATNGVKQADIAKSIAYFSDKYWGQYEKHMSFNNNQRPNMNTLDYKSCINKTVFMERISQVLDVVKKSRSLDVVQRSLEQYHNNLKMLYQQVTCSNDSNESPSFSFSIPDNLNGLFNFSRYRECILSSYSSFYSQVLNTPKSSYIVNKCIDYIHKNYTEPINLSSISAEFNISYSYLSYLFVKQTNIKMHHYINNVRIEHAKQLLRTSSMKMYEVAQAVGFESPYYFSKIFKEKTGATCSEYKKDQQSIPDFSL